MVKILLVRHGETNYNVQGLCNSSGSEVFLTPKGIEQAKELALHLKNTHIDEVIVSPTFRTKETLKHLQLNLPTKEEERISELKTGYEGKPIKKYLDLIQDSIKGKLDGGESVEDLYLRVSEFIEELKGIKYKNKIILVVTHSMVIKVAQIINQRLPLSEIDNLVIPKNGEVLTMVLS